MNPKHIASKIADFAATGKIQLPKVDNLRHISDHGLKAEFEIGSLQRAVVDFLASRPAGDFTLEAGESSLCVRRFGQFTLVDPDFSNSQPLPALFLTADAPAAPQAKIRSRLAPKAWRVLTGAELPGTGTDTASQTDSPKEVKARVHSNALLFAPAAMLRAVLRAPECAELSAQAFAAGEKRCAHESALSVSASGRKHSVDYALQRGVTEEERHAGVLAALSGADLVARVEQLGGYVRYRYSIAGSHRPIVISAIAPTLTPDHTANYRIQRQPDGTLRLSSGLSLPFSEADFLAFVRGERPAPRTSYGAVTLVNGRRGATPVVLAVCGCHRIDVAQDLGGDYVALLAPKHTVTVTPGLEGCEIMPANPVEIEGGAEPVYDPTPEQQQVIAERTAIALAKEEALHESTRREVATYLVSARAKRVIEGDERVALEAEVADLERLEKRLTAEAAAMNPDTLPIFQHLHSRLVPPCAYAA